MAEKSSRPLARAAGAERGVGNDCVRRNHTTDEPQRQCPSHGYVVAGVWRKAARASVHMLRNPRGWAVDLSDLNAAERGGARYVAIFDQESLQTFWAAIETVWQRGLVIERGCGRQLALTLDRWAASKQEAALDGEPGVSQLSLFGGRP